MKEFSLSEKRRELFDLLIKIIPTKAGRVYRIIRKQDEEAVKLLKKEMKNSVEIDDSWEGVEWSIDKIFGDKLSK